MKVTVHENLCIGCGICELEYPDIFQLGDDGLAHPVSDDLDEEQYGDARDAIAICPVEAISVGP